VLLGIQSPDIASYPNRLELSTVPVTKTQILHVILPLDLCYVKILALSFVTLAYESIIKQELFIVMARFFLFFQRVNERFL